ncbi:hypothetical protein ACQKRQ_24215 [Paraburkholderia sp. NPDC080076]|uniref:hypothetical protein n=1 Tax=Paraburkholderia sp. NPDC080076 TaxID=3390605 RepID=UPI003D0327FD
MVTDAGINEWADTNKLVVVYPDTIASSAPGPTNPHACFDWWGCSNQYGPHFARKKKGLADVGALRDGAARDWPAVGPSWHGSNQSQRDSCGWTEQPETVIPSGHRIAAPEPADSTDRTHERRRASQRRDPIRALQATLLAAP